MRAGGRERRLDAAERRKPEVPADAGPRFLIAAALAGLIPLRNCAAAPSFETDRSHKFDADLCHCPRGIVITGDTTRHHNEARAPPTAASR